MDSMNDSTKSERKSKSAPEPVAEAGGYRVLARKYRPASFDDLIGQDAMVRTISNAFETGRIPQAWILTGVRGVGKTTTARILARALNYELPDGSVTGPTIKIPKLGIHCQAIIEAGISTCWRWTRPRTTASMTYGRSTTRSATRRCPRVRKCTSSTRCTYFRARRSTALLKTLEEPLPP
jgi:hypothetical protein